MTEAEISNDLWREFALPPKLLLGKRGVSRPNRAMKVRAADATVSAAVEHLRLSEQWATGTPSKHELITAVRNKVGREVVGFFNPMWIWYFFQIARWVIFIWNRWHDDRD